jgi:phenol hydroxylase P1 protein
MNNTFVCGYGYGTVFTQPCMYHAMDNLGIAQYLSRLGLLLGSTDALDAGKAAWMEGDAWQGCAATSRTAWWCATRSSCSWPERGLDGLLYPLVYERIVDDQFAAEGGARWPCSPSS